ncbi:MAG: RNA polymerase sigma factor [Planctomycetota bacterium]|jgi:RNA polymerase sigma-70 factor (ECF subfamily)
MTSNRTSSTEAGQPADELRLVRRAQRGDRCALEELSRLVRPGLVHLLNRRIGCWADAEDIAQQALLRAFERIDQHDGRRRFSVWLYRIALRIAADHHRKARPEPGLDSSRLCDPRGDDPQEKAADGELRENLWSIAQQVLSADQYSVLWLRYAEDMSMKEAARVLGRTRISTRVLLHRARQRLAPHLLPLVDAERTGAPADAPTPVKSRK